MNKYEKLKLKQKREKEVEQFKNSLSKEERTYLIHTLINDLDNELYDLEKG